MKQCPQCKNTYADDDLFCLDDGAALVSTGSYSGDAPTVVIPQYSTPIASPTPTAPPNQSQNKWVYPVMGILAGLVVVLGFLAFYKMNSQEKTPDTVAVKENSNKETPTPPPFATPAQMPVQPPPVPPANAGSLPGRFPEGSARLLSSGDLAGKSNWDLRIMRNEIFARYGYIFKNNDLRNYFLSQPWYRPQYDNVNSFLSEVEKRNVMLLKSYE